MHFPASHNFLTSGKISIEEIIPLLGCEPERGGIKEQSKHAMFTLSRNNSPLYFSLVTQMFRFMTSPESIWISWIIFQFLWEGGCSETGRDPLKLTQFLGFCSKQGVDHNIQQIICRRDVIKRWSVKASFYILSAGSDYFFGNFFHSSLKRWLAQSVSEIDIFARTSHFVWFITFSLNSYTMWNQILEIT